MWVEGQSRGLLYAAPHMAKPPLGVILDLNSFEMWLFLDHSTESRGLQLTVSIGTVFENRAP
jgi:hypothetical protein